MMDGTGHYWGLVIGDENRYDTIPIYGENYLYTSGFVGDKNIITYGFRPVFTIKKDVYLRSDVGDGMSPDTAYEFDI